MTVDEVIAGLRKLGNPLNIAGMERFAIVTRKSFGVPTPVLKQFAKEVKKQATDRHALAQELWETGIYDARAVAFLIDDPKLVTKKQMDAWAKDFDNWATVDGSCGYLFCRTPFAYEKAVEWAGKGIRVIDVAPGYIETDLNRDAFAGPLRDYLAKRIPGGKHGTPEDVARLVAAIFTEDLPFLNGETIYLDGAQGIAH